MTNPQQPTALGWWQASDGRWYPPELHPSQPPAPQALPTFGSYVPPEDSAVLGFVSPAGQRKSKTPALWFGGAVAVVAVVVGLVLVISGGSGKTAQTASSAAAPPATTNGPALLSLARQYGSALATETAAAQGAFSASGVELSDITKQNQRIQQDQTTYNGNSYGAGCSVVDFSTYESCVQGEEQQASNAQTDEAAANAQIQTDEQQYASTASTLEAALSAFIGQVVAMPWPASMTTSIENMLRAARQYRNDVAQQGSTSSGTSQATSQAIQAQTGVDLGNFNDALSAVKAELLQLGASVQGTT